MATITSKAQLRELYPPAVERAVKKQMASLDRHARRFIELSPFVTLATTGTDGLGDVTPRGGEPGQVKVENDNAVLLPDWPGNNRLDSLENIIDHPGVGLLFLIPGV
ncbi:MAG: pyridoxamine 5'-phosphate oxidase family protein, partial [Alphaproteobacteria bacterium]|nr:pyridoxamine 5'-phosphate oxidase family protein [Alphaproteobacteria bacterium]